MFVLVDYILLFVLVDYISMFVLVDYISMFVLVDYISMFVLACLFLGKPERRPLESWILLDMPVYLGGSRAWPHGKLLLTTE
jgi:hypothetical protein